MSNKNGGGIKFASDPVKAWSIEGLGDWSIPALSGFPELGISAEELQPGYNDDQEKRGQLAWDRFDELHLNSETKHEGSKEKSGRSRHSGRKS